MRRVDLKRRQVDVAALKLTEAPKPGDYSQIIDEPALLYVDGELAGIYAEVPPEALSGVRAAVERIEYSETYRTGGLKTRSRVVGFQPRVTVRRDYCGVAALAKESPKEHALICQGATLSSAYFKEHLPAPYVEHERIVLEKTKPCWVLPKAAYTSAIVNWNNQLNYHCDSGNYPGTWNAMLTFKRDLEGGHLAIPELDIALAVRDSTLSIFNAQALLHGVTPFRKTSPRGYRYTIVYYALQGMGLCGSPAEELARIRQVKTAREVKRRSEK